jgi:hypothetical protein
MSPGSLSTSSPTPRVQVPRHVARLVTRLVVDYFDYATRPGASTRRAARHAARRAARHRLLCLRRVSRCLGMSRGSSRGTSRGSSSTTSTTPRVRVPQHVAQLVTRLVTRLIVDYFDYAARSGASARRAARHAAHRAARRRLLRLRRASGCLGISRGSSCGSSSTTSPTPCVRVPQHVARLVVDFFAYAAHPGASARRAARRRLLRLPQPRRRLLRLHCASGCLGTLCGSLSTSSPTPCVRAPRYVARLVVVDGENPST